MLGKRVNIMRPFHRNPSITALSFDFSRILKNVEARGTSGEDLCSALIIFRKNSGSSSPKLLSTPVRIFCLFIYFAFLVIFRKNQSCCLHFSLSLCPSLSLLLCLSLSLSLSLFLSPSFSLSLILSLSLSFSLSLTSTSLRLDTDDGGCLGV